MKLLLKLTGGLIAIAVIGFGIYWGPSQVQTLTINPDLPEESALRELMSAENRPTSVKMLLNAEQEVGEGFLAHTVFVVEWENGDKFLVDLGMGEETANLFAERFVNLFGAGEETFYGDISRQMGEDITNVKGISLTHLHGDHIQGLEVFCKAHSEGAILLQSETQRAVHNFSTRDSAALIEDSCLTRAKMEGDTLLTNENFPGIGIVPMGGHSPGSSLIAVAVNDHLWLFAGDAAFSKDEVDLNLSKPLIYTTFIIPENRFQNARLRDWMGKLDANDDMDIIISHDAEAIDKTSMERYSQ